MRVEVEASLRERIDELELKLLDVQKDANRLRTERHSVSDSEPEQQRIAVEKEQVG